MTLKIADVLYFIAELLVYAAVAWWGFSREVPGLVRWCLGLGGVAVFAATWGVLASPRANFALQGAAGLLFRVVWFGLGATAAIVVLSGRWSTNASR